MLTLIDKGEPREAHPAYWAPFIVVGEGAAGNLLDGTVGIGTDRPFAAPHQSFRC